MEKHIKKCRCGMGWRKLPDNRVHNSMGTWWNCQCGSTMFLERGKIGGGIKVIGNGLGNEVVLNSSKNEVVLNRRKTMGFGGLDHRARS